MNIYSSKKSCNTNLLDIIKNGKLEKTHKVTKVSLAQQQQNLLSDIDLCQRMFFLCLDNSLRRRIYVNKWRNMFCVPKVNNTGLLICMTPWNHMDRILYTNERLSKSLCKIIRLWIHKIILISFLHYAKYQQDM